MNKKDFYFNDAYGGKKRARNSLGKFKLEESKYDMGVCIDSTHPNLNVVILMYMIMKMEVYTCENRIIVSI